MNYKPIGIINKNIDSRIAVVGLLVGHPFLELLSRLGDAGLVAGATEEVAGETPQVRLPRGLNARLRVLARLRVHWLEQRARVRL